LPCLMHARCWEGTPRAAEGRGAGVGATTAATRYSRYGSWRLDRSRAEQPARRTPAGNGGCLRDVSRAEALKRTRESPLPRALSNKQVHATHSEIRCNAGNLPTAGNDGMTGGLVVTDGGAWSGSICGRSGRCACSVWRRLRTSTLPVARRCISSHIWSGPSVRCHGGVVGKASDLVAEHCGNNSQVPPPLQDPLELVHRGRRSVWGRGV
jgi:hypothetical protein